MSPVSSQGCIELRSGITHKNIACHEVQGIGSAHEQKNLAVFVNLRLIGCLLVMSLFVLHRRIVGSKVHLLRLIC